MKKLRVNYVGQEKVRLLNPVKVLILVSIRFSRERTVSLVAASAAAGASTKSVRTVGVKSARLRMLLTLKDRNEVVFKLQFLKLI